METAQMLAAHYSEKAKAFLKTVVCFDDEPGDVSGQTSMKALAATYVDSGFGDDEQTDQFVRSQSEVKLELADVSHPLDFRATANAFAKDGILCSVLKPELSGDDLVQWIANLANTADVTVLDWELEGRTGGSITCQKAIKAILEGDRDSGGRLRLLVVYTATDGDKAIEDLLKYLDEFEVSRDEGQCALKGNQWRIVVFQKPDTFKPTTDKLDYPDLPKRVVHEFSKLTNGLLPTAVLHGITAIRGNAHRLLAIFDRDLDGAFLTHRALIPDPQDAGDFFLEVLEDEISALMRNCGIKDCVGKQYSEGWVRSKAIGTAKQDALVNAVTQPSQQKVKELGAAFGVGKDKQKVADTVLAELSGEGVATKASERLSQLVGLYGACIPPAVDEQRMQLGVLVFDEINRRYLMCLQPLCDSVRIARPTLFPFLILEEVIDGAGTGSPTSKDLYVQLNSGSGIWLQTTLMPNKLISYEYDPSGESDGTVWKAKQLAEGKSAFSVCVAGKIQQLTWVGEVKLGKAQRISSGIAARFHTLGIDEFEWQRLHQK